MDDRILVEWDDRYLVDIPVIDEQHKELIRMTNTLYQGCLQGDVKAKVYFMETVHGTVDYVKYHFSAEEKILESVQYPGIGEHKKEHEGFIRQIFEQVKSFEGGRKFVPNDFVRYLKDWILAHIALTDKKYAEYIHHLQKQGKLTTLNF
ncbi:MAG: bacteriohemerythrin [Spirochaetaceae bacterium]|jgi:hemerythrin|nr:bacteriohemerythrin [Spirochaetaceae bacterium]